MRIDASGHGRAASDPPEDCACEVCATMALLGRKWTLDVLGVLHERGRVRFNELKRELDGVSPRTLTDRLDQLVEEAIVDRIDHEQTPPKVEYALAEDGRQLVDALEELVAWAEGRG